ncbi:MAG: phage holin family protein [Candidatus Blackburnbacteria bacterium]|nr:phage holin family protein [Candidatus Blackburnbacteria bacterium]
MKRFLRSFFIHLLVIWFVANSFGGINYQNNLQYLALGALALTFADSLLKPLINLLLLPFNLVTLGLFRWVSGVVTLYIATTLVRGFSIVSFTYPGFQSNMFIIPSITFSTFAAFIVVSFVISLISSFLFWISK